MKQVHPARDMSPADTRAALLDLKSQAGSRADVYAYLETKGKYPFSACLYPDGVCGSSALLRGEGDTWAEVVTSLTEAWATHSDLHAEAKIKAISLAIISLTHLHGECTDAMLRADFDATDIKRFGGKAVERANEMAERGPFSITTMSGANDVGQAA